MRVAVLGDWQASAEGLVDWSALRGRAEVVFFHDAFADEDDAARQLDGFDIIMPMRERTAFPASLIDRLPRLKLFSMTGSRGGSLDLARLQQRGVTISTASGTGRGTATAELALGLILAAVRHIPAGDAAIRAGGFQRGVPSGLELSGRVLGVIGLGKLGSLLARYARALDMEVIAWSQNLTEAQATAGGARLVGKDELVGAADVISLHLVLSDRSRGTLGSAEFSRMKQGALVVNTSRGPLIDEPALISALQAGKISAALDVYDIEPLPVGHPFRTLPNVLLTPHLGYVTEANMRAFYQQGVENVLAFLDGTPIRVLGDVTA